MHHDLPVTRKTIDRLDGWFEPLARPLLPLHKVRESDGDFHWEFKEQTPQVLQVGKAVRMISGIRAALVLADSGYSVECLSLLRIVSDFAQEIVAIAEALLEGRLTKAQAKFVEQYFAPLASSADEHEQQERERYVTREELLKAHGRLHEKTTGDAPRVLKLSRFVSYTYDKYVHGAYLTATELYRGDQHRFMLRGHEGDVGRHLAYASVNGKLHEVVSTLGFMSLTRGEKALTAEIQTALQELEDSVEKGF